MTAICETTWFDLVQFIGAALIILMMAFFVGFLGYVIGSGRENRKRWKR